MMIPTKQSLRTLFLQKRTAIPLNLKRIWDGMITDRFAELDLSAVKVIHIFLSIEEQGEVDTGLIIAYLKAVHPQLKILVPQSDFKTLLLRHFLMDEALVIQKNKHHIPEPIAGNEVDPKEIDLVLVPLLAFDREGYRVGYGKGFYDRFLAQCRPDVRTIGLSYFEPVERIIDRDEFDIPLQACITPHTKW